MKKIIFSLVMCFACNAFGMMFLPPSFHASFEQVVVSIVTGKEKVSTGTLDYVYPSNLRLSLEKPDALLLISNKNKTWFFRPAFIEGERDELTVKESGKTELTLFFDILRKGLSSNEYYLVKQTGKEVELEFTAKGEKAVGVKKANLFFEDKVSFDKLLRVKVQQNAKKSFDLRFKQMTLNPKFPDNHFVFTAATKVH